MNKHKRIKKLRRKLDKFRPKALKSAKSCRVTLKHSPLNREGTDAIQDCDRLSKWLSLTIEIARLEAGVSK